MIKPGPCRRAVWVAVRCLCSLTIWLLVPAGLLAQSPATGISGLDEWRRLFTQRLDHDLAKLGTDARNDQASITVTRQFPAEGEPETQPLRRPLPLARPSRPALSAIEGILAAEGLPAALQGIAAVESRFNPAALSPKGARGLWQLMPETARRYGLTVDGHRDDRLDLWKSTYVAARYLRDLYAQFRDWLLVLAAYNAGEGRVQNALERFGARDFWTLSRRLALPEETRRYVPAVLDKSGRRPGAWAGTYLASSTDSFRPERTAGVVPKPAAARITYAVTSAIPSPVTLPAPPPNDPENSP